MEVNYPRNELTHKLYCQLLLDQQSIEMDFTDNIDPTTLGGNIRFSDKSGDLSNPFDIMPAGNIVLLMHRSPWPSATTWLWH